MIKMHIALSSRMVPVQANLGISVGYEWLLFSHPFLGYLRIKIETYDSFFST